MKIVNAPRINPNDEEVGLVAWHVEEGGHVEIGAQLADLETSKATVTVDSEIAGFVHRLVTKGDVIHVGAPICEIFETALAAQKHAARESVPSATTEVVEATS